MKQIIEWKRVNLQGENKNLPEANRCIYFKVRYKDLLSNPDEPFYVGISTGITTLTGMKCENYKSLPDGTIFIRMSDGCSFPIDTDFEWDYADVASEVI